MISVIKDMTVFLDPEPVSQLAYRVGARVAESWQAHLTAVFSVPEISYNPWVRGKAIRSALNEHLEVFKRDKQRIRADFEKVCERHGVVSEWRSQEMESPGEIIVHACYSALSV